MTYDFYHKRINSFRALNTTKNFDNIFNTELNCRRSAVEIFKCIFMDDNLDSKVHGANMPTWGPSGSCRPQMGLMLAPWTLLLGNRCNWVLIQLKLYRRDSIHNVSRPLKVYRDPIHNKALLIQSMVGAEQATSHYMNQRWPSSLPHLCVIRTQWFESNITLLSIGETFISNGINIKVWCP